MAASISIAGNSVMETKSLSPIKPDNKLNNNAVEINTTVHISPNTKNARQLRKQATVLKNKLLMAGTPCQYRSAGACQNTIDKGRYNKNDSHMAF